ncbi:MAG: DNA-binding protein [Oscillospiraceae bacterium]|nr:DNA-binding protein [Oscillospiraceae bacterium]
MKEEPLEMSMLFDFYGDVLTDKQKDLFDLYHNHDMSLGEIAVNENITRQGVRDVIVRATQTLRSMEDKLKLVGRYKAVQNGLLEIREAAASIEDINNRRYGSTALRDFARRIQELAADIAEET